MSKEDDDDKKDVSVPVPNISLGAAAAVTFSSLLQGKSLIQSDGRPATRYIEQPRDIYTNDRI